MPASRPGEIILGDHKRNSHGHLIIRGNRMWIPYPPVATELINLANELGWGVDDGLPVRRLLDNTIYVRILIGRERGPNALYGPDADKHISPGTQFHLTWRLNGDTWETGTGYVKVGIHPRFRDNEWRKSTADFARRVITGYPVKTPSDYADEGEHKAC